MLLQFEDELWLVLTISEKNSEGKTLAPTPRSATAREMMKALILVRSRRLLQTRKIMEPFPAAATIDSVQPRIVNQVSIETGQLQLPFSLELIEKAQFLLFLVKGRSCD